MYVSDLNQERVAQARLFGAEESIPADVKVDAIVEVGLKHNKKNPDSGLVFIR